MKHLLIFRAGTHTAMDGTTLEFTERDLRACAAAYDPAVHEAPLVVGHPKDNSPAWGWVSKAAVHGGVLGVIPRQVDPNFEEAVAAGRYKKLSASFYLPDSPANPKPGVLYLRHVGFLGGQAPAVKGLPGVEFSDSDEGVIEFSEDIAAPDPGDQGQPNPPEGDDMPMDEATKARLEKLDALEAENAQLKAAAARKAQDDLHKANSDFCEGLAASGQLTPQDAAVYAAALDVLATQPVDFGEGDEATPLTDAVRKALKRLPKAVDYGEHGQEKETPEHVSFAAPSGYAVDPKSAETHAKAKAYQKANPGTDYFTAVTAVAR